MSKYTDTKAKEIMQLVLAEMKTAGTNFMSAWVKSGMPRSIHGRVYSGINLFQLWATKQSKGFESNTWATFNHIRGLKTSDGEQGMVNKGAKATFVCGFFKSTYKTVPTQGVNKGQEVEKNMLHCKFYPVFNLDQTNIKDKDLNVPNLAKDMESVETYIANTKAEIRISTDNFDSTLNDSCFYSPTLDYIHMVDKKWFVKTQESNATENYYTVLLHELTHWTMHKDRCNRSFLEETKKEDGTSDPKSAYAMEELVAEMGSAIQSCLLGITSKPKKESAQYLNIWINRLENNTKLFWSMCSHASKAVSFIEKLQNKSVKKLKKAS